MMKVKPRIQRKLSKSRYIAVHCQKKCQHNKLYERYEFRILFLRHMYIFSQTLTGPQLYSAQAQKILNSHKGGLRCHPPPLGTAHDRVTKLGASSCLGIA